MSLKKCLRLLALLIAGLWLAVPALADDGDGALTLCDFPPIIFNGPFPCPDFGHDALQLANHLRPGSVIVFPKFVRSGGNVAACGTGNVLVDGVCLPRTEISLGATCPTLFTVGSLVEGEIPQTLENFPCPEHDPVRVRFRWVCPGTERNPTCRTSGFDVLLSVNGKIVFAANGFALADANQVQVPAAPCDRGYLIGWVIDNLGQPIKYDGLIGEAVIRNSGTAAAAYRGITIQAQGKMTPSSVTDPSVIDPVPDPLGSPRMGLPFFGLGQLGQFPNSYRAVTGQVTGDVTFDSPPPASGPGFGGITSLILLTLDVRANSRNFPTFVDLNFWNGSERLLSSALEFVCWGEFQLSVDIDPNLTQAFMGTRNGIVQSGEAVKVPVSGVSDISGHTTLLGLVQTDEIPADGRVERSHIVEFYNNGIRYWSTAFFP
jgi:hypothetical protein